MANYYTIVVPECGLPCLQKDADRIAELLDTEDASHGFDISYEGRQLYLIAEESGSWDDLPEDALQLIGKLINRAKMPHWEFGVAYTASRIIAGSHGGSAFRIMPDGSIATRTCYWPDSDEPISG